MGIYRQSEKGVFKSRGVWRWSFKANGILFNLFPTAKDHVCALRPTNFAHFSLVSSLFFILSICFQFMSYFVGKP